MNTTNEYLQSILNSKASIVEHLVDKNINAKETESLQSLVDKIAHIQTIDTASGIFTPSNDTSTITISGLSFRPSEITIVSSVPESADASNNVNIAMKLFDDAKSTLGNKYGFIVVSNKGTFGTTMFGTHNAFTVTDDGFTFTRAKSIFKSGYSYYWAVTGKNTNVSTGNCIFDEDTEYINIDFGSFNPSAFAIYADSGTVTSNPNYALAQIVLIPSISSGNKNNVMSLKSDGTISVTFVASPIEITEENGKYILTNLTASNDVYSIKFAKDVVYKWVAISE